MPSNRGVVYTGPGKVEVRSIDFPKLVDPRGKKVEHGVILKVVATNICGSDQHMVRGRTTAPPGLVLGHEITGEVIEAGRTVEVIKVGDLVSAPFNVACGRCRNCRERNTGVCLTVNPGRAGGAYGYVDMGGWIGGQAEYVMIPYADFQLLKFPDKAQAMEKMQDLTCLTDIVSDFNGQRLAQAASFGCETIDLSKGGSIVDHLERILGVPEVDCAVDCVGFEAKQQGGEEQPSIVLNELMTVTRAAGRIGIPGLYVTQDPGAKDEAAKTGNLSLHFGLGWAKSHALFTGQTPVMKYNRGLMMAILHDRIHIAKAVNTAVISLDAAPQGYADFDKGAAKKFVIDPHGSLTKAA